MATRTEAWESRLARDLLWNEGQKYAKLAAFEAALAEIRKGNRLGAVEAAKKAAAETLAAWCRCRVVEQASVAASIAVGDTANVAATAATGVPLENAGSAALDVVNTVGSAVDQMESRVSQHVGQVFGVEGLVFQEQGKPLRPHVEPGKPGPADTPHTHVPARAASATGARPAPRPNCTDARACSRSSRLSA